MATKAELIHDYQPALTAGTTPLSESIIAGISALLDAAVVAGSGLLIYGLYVAPQVPDKLPLYAAVIAVYTLLLSQTFQLTGLYRFSRITRPHQQAVRIAALCIVLFLGIVTCAFALKISEQFSRLWAFMWLVAAIILILAARLTVASVVRRWAAAGRLSRNIVIFGGGGQGGQLIRHIDTLREPWNRVVAVFDDRQSRVPATVEGRPMLGGLQDLLQWGRHNRTDEILLALPWTAQDRILAILRELAILPANVRLSPEFIGADLLQRRTCHQFKVPMLSVLEKPVSGWGAFWKTILDFALGSLFLPLALPFMAVAALWIKLESPGPVLFRQKRYGFNNQLIEVYKFRTMYADQTDEHAERLTLPDDPRVTRVGAFLRRYSLDELPQLFNVLKGNMSVVGPRPHALKAKAGGKLYEEVVDQYAVRHKVKPGITGWAQVNGWRGNTTTEEALIGRLEHDLYYIENWSLLLDLIIIFRTFNAVLKGRNSY